MTGDEPACAAAQYDVFMAQERARTAAEQERRRQCLSQRVTAEDLAEVEQQQIDEQSDDTAEEEFDPWINLLRTVETRAGVKVKYDSDGNREFRVASRYLLESVIGAEPQHCNYSYASIRLGKLMRKLGWTGPKLLRMEWGTEKRARGYSKAEIKEAKAA
jgi:hypothetical protein